MSNETIVLPSNVPWIQRVRRFVMRVTASLIMMAACAFLILHQVDLVTTQRALDHPVLAALDEVGASLRTTELTATAVIREGTEATMEELKRYAGSIALSQDSDVQLWSDLRPQYQAVYFQGSDPAGGIWIASARYLISEIDGIGRVEISLRRDLTGRIDDLRHALHQMKTRLQRVGGPQVHDVQLDVRFQARPPSSDTPGGLIDSFMQSVGIDSFTRFQDADGYSAAGFSTRIPGSTRINGRLVNVMVRVSQRGQDRWLEVGSPAL